MCIHSLFKLALYYPLCVGAVVYANEPHESPSESSRKNLAADENCLKQLTKKEEVRVGAEDLAEKDPDSLQAERWVDNHHCAEKATAIVAKKLGAETQ